MKLVDRVNSNRYGMMCLALAVSWLAFGVSASAQTNKGTDKFKLPEGFVADLVYDVPNEQGSWVSMTTDDQGRLIACDQYGFLYRVTLTDDQPKIEKIEASVGSAQGLLYAFDSLYVMSSGSGGGNNGPKCEPGLYRLRDTTNDDQFDEVKFLRLIRGRGEHGPHAIVLSPDKKSIHVCGGNMATMPEIDASRQKQVWQEDQIIKRYPDARGHANGVMAPGGWICKTDPEGKSFELVASGFRNEYDFDFDPNGEIFTYDADMEWDVGLPWYRPTRICHAVSGAEFGWRHGSGKWPTYYQDSVPPVVEIGPGSPTGVVFGTNAKFPAKYQHAFFASDWSYGIIYAVHLTPSGGTYTGEKEIFCTAPALPVTDVVINQHDGAMYFLIGGRRSQSALYRIRYTGSESTEPAEYPALTDAAKKRMELESGHRDNSELSLDTIMNGLQSKERAIRYAARIALEHKPVDSWKDLIKTSDARRRIEMVTALTRVAPDQQELATAALADLDYNSLSPQLKLNYLRAFGLVLARQGEPGEATLAAINKLAEKFPAESANENLELGKLLVAVNNPKATQVLVQLLQSPASQETQIGYALILSAATEGWNTQLRDAYLKWFREIAIARGGNSFDGYLLAMRKQFFSSLSREDMMALLAQLPPAVDPYAQLKARPLVKDWELSDLMPIKDQELENRDLANGKKIFAVATCYKCHRVRGEGGIVGPDLTAAGRRFNTHDLLETIIEPSKAISDQYEAHQFMMFDGRVIVGRVVNLSGNSYRVQPDMAEPNNLVGVNVDDIEAMKPSPVSPMPTGLLDYFSRDEILDLLAYMKSTATVENE